MSSICTFENKGKCRNRDDCDEVHPKGTCQNYSKLGSCPVAEGCKYRHPSGICWEWERVYGSQECRMTNDNVTNHWEEIRTEITKIEARGEWTLLLGDSNRHFGDIVFKNDDKISFGGKMIRNFLEDGNYVLLNGTGKVTGGPWTRILYGAPVVKSVLDIVIASKDLADYLKVMEIDEMRNFTPCKPLSNGKVSYSDHLAIKITFEGIPMNRTDRKVVSKSVRWNLNKQSLT